MSGFIVRTSGKSSLVCEGSVKSDTGRRPGREGVIHMGTILNLSKRQMYLLKVVINFVHHFVLSKVVKCLLYKVKQIYIILL